MNRFTLALAVTLSLAAAAAPAADDVAYTQQIRQFTTGPQFTTELVDHLPASEKVPTPLAVLGYVAGAEGHLTYVADVNRYMRALEAASPRVKVFSTGRSEEGREMIVVAIANEETIANLDRYRDITRRLADPRTLNDDAAKPLIAAGKPIYYLTGAIHSPETGSPEMLMELAYRLAVEDTPRIQAIRDNVIVLMTPVIEVDGRDRMVDLWNYRRTHPNVPTPPLVYWGRYVAHDNNRDNIGLTLALSRNVMRAYFDFHPQVTHDLHESVPFQYISTGTGPYNASLDPLMVDAWQRMAWNEVTEMTKRNVPGVWTWGFYDGWAPNYMMWIGTGHNTIGRFYETFGNRWPTTETRVVRNGSERAWYRPNPPLPQVRWSLRNNVNYQQSSLLFALTYVAENRSRFLEEFYAMGKRAVAKATTEGPAAWVIDGAQKRSGNVRDLVATLRRHGIEVQVADEPFTLKTNWPPSAANEPVSFAKGSLVVRMDQPYSRLADTLLDVQFVRPDEKVYDDTGWTLGYLKNVDVKRVANADVLKVRMHAYDDTRDATANVRGTYAVANAADLDLARLRFANRNARIAIADEAFTAGGKQFPAGTAIASDVEPGALAATPLPSMPTVKSHELKAPRIALLHTWQSTQDEGWWRIGFESLGVPYTYLSTQQIASMGDLRERFDVVVFPPADDSEPQEIVNGFPAGPPLPWRKTDVTPNLGGIDETDDMRPGLGLAGVQNLARFVENGGLLITARDTAAWAVEYGLARYMTIVPPQKLKAPGTIVSASVVDRKSPVVAGYDDTLPIYFAGSPIFRVGNPLPPERPDARPSGRGGRTDPDVPQGRPFVPAPERAKPAAGEEGFPAPDDAPWLFEVYRPQPQDRPKVIVAFASKADQLLLSGMLEGGDEIAGKPAIVDAPLGKGHILLFANNPMWRGNTQGSYPLVMNAIMNWDVR